MFGIYAIFSEYYYIIIALQAYCVFHAIRTGNQNRWIWLIVFLPLVGSLIYLFTEVFTRRRVSTIQTDVVKLVNPGSKIKELEKRYEFSSTFANRVALADAYLERGQNEKAIELCEPALTGLFETNEHVIEKLIHAYFNVGRYDDVVRVAPKISKKINFNKTRANLLYALALEKINRDDEAEKEFQSMNRRYSNYEARYHYGMFLLSRNEEEKASEVFSGIINEAKTLSRKEKGESSQWIDKATQQWNNLAADSKV